MKINIPGKTFLLGEYAVLQGGSALVACTAPCFELTLLAKDKIHHPFHSESPAGKFIADHQDIFETLNLAWSSPYSEGGFGGSTAEFLSCFKLYFQLTEKTFSQEALYQTYLKYAYNKVGYPPSGADLIAQSQMQEGLVYVSSNKTSIPVVLNWPFDDLSLLLFKTPYKLPTHHYLQNLKTLPDYSTLKNLTVQGFQALQQKDAKTFINTINGYASSLTELNLTSEPTQSLLDDLRKHPDFLAAKGCGALGADVIAVIAPKEHEKEWILFCEGKELRLKK